MQGIDMNFTVSKLGEGRFASPLTGVRFVDDEEHVLYHSDLRAIKGCLEAGMDVARINFSHGDFSSHQRVIHNLRQAASAMGRRLAILTDLPGPKVSHESERRVSEAYPGIWR
jgi:hypothetical protein